jgi:hypothetical protein
MERNSRSFKGWVYVYINPLLKGLVKIGFTTKTPQLRVKEQDQAGLPYSHELVYEALILDAQRVEQKVHKALKDKNENKEWFRCTVSEAIKKIKEIAGDDLLLEEGGESENIEVIPVVSQNDPINTEEVDSMPFESKGHLNFSVQRVQQACSVCRKQYSVTLTRYEKDTICPHCHKMDSTNIIWK